MVVAGGLFFDLRLSALLLQKSLVIFGQKKQEKVEITDDTITSIVKNDVEFKTIINQLLMNCDKNVIELENYRVEFNDKDLLFSIHGASLNIKGNKNIDGTWNLMVEIVDTYDYTDFKSLNKYITSNNSSLKSIFSVTLNNFAVVSSKYGVIKPYTVIIKFEMKNYLINEVRK